MKILKAVGLWLAACASAFAARVDFLPDAIDAHYSCGETAVVKVTVLDDAGTAMPTGEVSVAADDFGPHALVPGRKIDLAKENPFEVRAARTTPGFVRISVRGFGKTALCGLGYDTGKIVPGTPDVADFDRFWSDAVRNLETTVPLDPQVERIDRAGDFDVFRLSFASCGGRRVWGWLVEPKDKTGAPFPVRFTVPGAGIGFTNPPDGVPGVVRFVMNVHTYPQPEGHGAEADARRKAAYEAQGEHFRKLYGLRDYYRAGIHKSREDYFYYAAILGINRALDWVLARPECDLKRVSYSGTSQGGGMGLALTYLNGKILRSCIFVPAMTDLLGYRVEGRESGWPKLVEHQLPENRAAAEKNAPYFCGVNFARRIRKPIRFVAGFIDCTCPPAAVYSAYNVCPSADKRISDGLGMGHGVYGDFYSLWGAWERDWNPAPSAADGSYRFLAFNIWGDYFGNPPHERDLAEAEVIRKWNPDFIGMQEVTANFWASRLVSALEGDYGVIGRGLGPKGTDAHDPVFYRKSRFEPVDSGAVWFCPELDWSKGAVWAVLKDRRTARNILIFASHFWWRYDGKGDDWIRLNNAQILHRTVAELSKKYDAAVIGGGDLNSPVTASGLRYLLAQGWKDAQESATVSPRGFTTEHGDPKRDAHGVYRGTPGVRGITRVPEKSQYLDHVFYDPQRVSVRRFHIDETPAACAASDHHPVIADFTLR